MTDNSIFSFLFYSLILLRAFWKGKNIQLLMFFFFLFNNCDFVGKLQKTKSNAQTINNCTKFLEHLGITYFQSSPSLQKFVESKKLSVQNNL